MRRLGVVLAMTAFSLAAIAAGKPVDHRQKVEFDELAAKASAVIETVNAMEDRARVNGQSLHPDLIARRALVQSSMEDAQEALDANDGDLLKERLKRARGHIERLNRML